MKITPNIHTQIADYLSEKRTVAQAIRNVGKSSGNIHLRNLGLSESDLRKISELIQSIDSNQAEGLRSISLSYNPDIGDQAVVRLIQALPASIREIGIVGCAIGDQAGRAILDWAKMAPNLKMICMEDNNFSNTLKSEFQARARLDMKSLLLVILASVGVITIDVNLSV